MSYLRPLTRHFLVGTVAQCGAIHNTAPFWHPIDEFVGKSLMRTLDVIILHIFVDDKTKMALTDTHHPIKALRLDRQKESFCVRILIWTLRRQPNRLHSPTLQDLTEVGGVQRIAIVNQMRLFTKEPRPVTIHNLRITQDVASTCMRCGEAVLGRRVVLIHLISLAECSATIIGARNL